MSAIAGLCTVIDAQAVQLISLKEMHPATQIWRARTLFVWPSDVIDVQIPVGADLRPLHTTYVHP